MDFRHSILIYNLPEAYVKDAVTSISERTTIPEKLIFLVGTDRWGVKLIFENEQNFRKVISLSVLHVRGKKYSLYPLVTDLIVFGKGPQVASSEVELLLERFAPVLIVYEVKNQQDVITFRAALNCPEIPEKIQPWTLQKFNTSGYEGTEFSISPFCRFCKGNGHFKIQCLKRQIPVVREVTLDFPSLPSRKVGDKHTTEAASSDSSTGFDNFAKVGSDSSTKCANFAGGSSDISAVCRNDCDMKQISGLEATSSNPLPPATNLKHLIPPSMIHDIEKLKLFFSQCKNFKHIYKSGLRYPEGIGTLLRQLRKIVKFNKDIKTKSEEEMKFIAWICLLLSKLQYLHLKKNIDLESFYEPSL
ncbi:unnamed protein product [Larinioides sclopetarius]|uniref:Uncharacterized protein n=1 Tax=Larinioides sclopetarius TaxID=280406 RepID=A0AAV2A3H2_9ARAC